MYICLLNIRHNFQTKLNLLPLDKKINIVFVEFPILSKQSYIAARAALASKKQGLYNKFHLSLMEITGRVDEEKVFRTAEKIGLNINQLKKDTENLNLSDLKNLIQQEKDKNFETKPSLATRQCSMAAIEKISAFLPQLIGAKHYAIKSLLCRDFANLSSRGLFNLANVVSNIVTY